MVSLFRQCTEVFSCQVYTVNPLINALDLEGASIRGGVKKKGSVIYGTRHPAIKRFVIARVYLGIKTFYQRCFKSEIFTY